MLRLNFKRKKRKSTVPVFVLIVLVLGLVVTLYYQYGDILKTKIIPEEEVKMYFLRGILIHGEEKYAIFLDNRGRRYMVKEGTETCDFRVNKIDSAGVILVNKNGKGVTIKW